MGILFSNKCELAIKAILYLSVLDKDNKVSAKALSDQIGIMKEYASKVLQELVVAGLICSKQGMNGGFYLDKNLEDILLIDIVRTVDGNGLFENCILGFPGCGSCESCPVHDKWGGIRAQIEEMLATRSLAELKPKTVKKLLEMIIGEGIKVPSWGCQG
jgi:Rrf2 family transcriptional regulator, iron-sulfur cluster assembly transcription factor